MNTIRTATGSCRAPPSSPPASPADTEAEELYAEHSLYFFNRCLHVYPGFADAPGYRTIKTIKAGMLSQVRKENRRDIWAEHADDTRWWPQFQADRVRPEETFADARRPVSIEEHRALSATQLPEARA